MYTWIQNNHNNGWKLFLNSIAVAEVCPVAITKFFIKTLSSISETFETVEEAKKQTDIMFRIKD